MTVKFGSAQDSIGRLKQAFDRLKKEAGKPANFMYPEDELEQEMYGENARLQSQLLEAEDQISALELDNTRVRKAMKNQAGMIGEQGFKFQGMNSAMLVTVNEFASNLREGKVDLPLNDRSAELLKENRRLKDEQKAMNLRIERYEREISGAIGPSQPVVESGPGSGAKGVSGGTVVSMSKVQEAELFGLRNDVQKLVSENTSMHSRMSTMQSELMVALKARGGELGDGTDSIASALLAANESLMRELIDARSMAVDRFTPRLDSLSEVEMPSGRQGLGQGQGQGYQSQAQLHLESTGGGRYPSKQPPAGSRRTSFLAGGTLRGDLQQDSLFTPGAIMFHDCCLFPLLVSNAIRVL